MKFEILLLVIFMSIYVAAADNSTNSSSSTTPSVLNVTTISSSTISTISSTTVLPLPSTSTPASKEGSLNITKQEVFKTMTANRTQLLNTTSYNCNCDITLNSCDVNCCCDIDCSLEVMSAFYCENSETNIEDYYQGGLEHCNINNGLFCIAKDNLGSPDYYVSSMTSNRYELTLNVAYHDEYESYKWYQESTEDVQQKFDIANEFYKFGDEILTFDLKSEKVNVLLLPATLTDTTCHVHEPVKFLNSKTVKCLKTINEILNYNDNLTKRLLNVQLFRRPLKTLTTVREGDLLNVTIITCKHTLNNCTNFVFNETSTEDLNLMETDDELYQDIFIHIGINDTIILNVTVYLISYDTLLLNSDLLLDDHIMNIIQKIEVKFENYHKSPKNLIRKRIRGYNIEEQILASQYRPLNESAAILENVLDYFRNDSHQITNDYILKLPESRNGQCVLNGKIYDQIRFNENTHRMCKVNFNLDGKLNNSTCQIIQSQILHFLIPMLNLTANNTDNFRSNIYVSKNWSPQYQITSWKRMDLNNIPDFNPEVQEIEKFLTCSKIPTSISYKIYSTRIRTSGTKKYENVIEKVEADFGNLKDIKLYGENENKTVQVEININVQFFNLYSKLHSPNNANDMLIGFEIIICSLSILKFM
ncbi:unnamed protein product [Diamesa serratosioi]